MKILLIEDEEKTARFVRQGLAESGFSVDVAADGRDGLALVRTFDYDLAILDLMLPGVDGWTVLETLRQGGAPLPVVVLSALGDVDDRVSALELGADDYLVKPFVFGELLARVRSVLRRSGGAPGPGEGLRVADLKIEPRGHRAMRGDVRLDLTHREFALLSLLVRRAGEVLTRRSIIEKVWDLDYDCGSNVVDVHIRRLRTKVDEPFDRRLIHTVRGVGYVLEDRGAE